MRFAPRSSLQFKCAWCFMASGAAICISPYKQRIYFCPEYTIKSPMYFIILILSGSFFWSSNIHSFLHQRRKSTNRRSAHRTRGWKRTWIPAWPRSTVSSYPQARHSPSLPTLNSTARHTATSITNYLRNKTSSSSIIIIIINNSSSSRLSIPLNTLKKWSTNRARLLRLLLRRPRTMGRPEVEGRSKVRPRRPRTTAACRVCRPSWGSRSSSISWSSSC